MDYETMLTQAKNIIFDLDNTLHDYRYSSKIAMDEVFHLINKRYSVPCERLRTEYAEILKDVELHAFLDGRSSYEYRRERFEKLLRRTEISPPTDFVAGLLATYEENLKLNLKPELELHETLSWLGKSKALYLATEGPEDAQLRTIEWLGIEKYFTRVFTSNRAEKRKSDGGLFLYILKETNSKKEETVVVGDSYKSDVLGAENAGLRAIWVNPSGVSCLGQDAGLTTIIGISELKRIF